MISRTFKRTAMVVIFAGLSLGGWFATRGDSATAQPSEAWSIRDPQWIETAGRYAVEVDLRRTVGEDYVNFDRPDYERWCGIVLADLPPHPSVESPEIYRVGLRVQLQDGTHTDRYRPVSVRDGRCQMVQMGGFSYVTYPAPLEGWVPFRQTFGPTDGGFFIEAIFDWIDEGDGPLSEFDPVFACQALLSDPPLTMKDWANSDEVREMKLFATVATPEPEAIGFKLSISEGVCSLEGAL